MNLSITRGDGTASGMSRERGALPYSFRRRRLRRQYKSDNSRPRSRPLRGTEATATLVCVCLPLTSGSKAAFLQRVSVICRKDTGKGSNCNTDGSFVMPAPFTHTAMLHIILGANGSDDPDSSRPHAVRARARQATGRGLVGERRSGGTCELEEGAVGPRPG